MDINDKEGWKQHGFAGFFEQHFRLLVKYIRRYGLAEGEAQDIAQESFYKLTRYGELSTQAMKALVYRISINAIRDLKRREAGAHQLRFENNFQLAEIPDDSPRPEQWAEQHEELARVRAALDRLPARCREIYLLNRIDGMSYSEIAKHCGISVKTVEKHISRALGLLKMHLLSSTSSDV